MVIHQKIHSGYKYVYIYIYIYSTVYILIHMHVAYICICMNVHICERTSIFRQPYIDIQDSGIRAFGSTVAESRDTPWVPVWTKVHIRVM